MFEKKRGRRNSKNPTFSFITWKGAVLLFLWFSLPELESKSFEPLSAIAICSPISLSWPTIAAFYQKKKNTVLVLESPYFLPLTH